MTQTPADMAIELFTKCQRCEGNCAYLERMSVPECCGRPTRSGECCGNAVEGCREELRTCDDCYGRGFIPHDLTDLQRLHYIVSRFNDFKTNDGQQAFNEEALAILDRHLGGKNDR